MSYNACKSGTKGDRGRWLVGGQAWVFLRQWQVAVASVETPTNGFSIWCSSMLQCSFTRTSLGFSLYNQKPTDRPNSVNPHSGHLRHRSGVQLRYRRRYGSGAVRSGAVWCVFCFFPIGFRVGTQDWFGRRYVTFRRVTLAVLSGKTCLIISSH